MVKSEAMSRSIYPFLMKHCRLMKKGWTCFVEESEYEVRNVWWIDETCVISIILLILIRATEEMTSFIGPRVHSLIKTRLRKVSFSPPPFFSVILLHRLSSFFSLVEFQCTQFSSIWFTFAVSLRRWISLLLPSCGWRWCVRWTDYRWF